MQAELDSTYAELRALKPHVEAHDAKIARAALRVERLKSQWFTQNPIDAATGEREPFDPEVYTPPAVVPPVDRDLTGRFHALHYRIADLQRELEEAPR